MLLADDVVVKRLLDPRRRQGSARTLPGAERRHAVPDDIHRAGDADIADVHFGSGDDALDLLRGAAAERAVYLFAGFGFLSHERGSGCYFFSRSFLM